MPNTELFTDTQIQEILRRELEMFPQAGLIDLYKLLYQAYQGPNHIAVSEQRFADFLKEELAAVSSRKGPALQDIGAGKGFYRIYLSAFIDSGVELSDELIHRFTRMVFESKQQDCIDPKSWKELWPRLELIVEACDRDMFGRGRVSPEHRAGELALIQNLIRIGGIPHHTSLYLENYNPHYRLVHVSKLDELMELLRLDFFKQI
ncbi:MAG TPA: hypothetical protein PLX59_00925 [Candidatus Cloacimonadota bacterium]|nr:hypothetical protein [Candidatus Cloacimonadota bacterium]